MLKIIRRWFLKCNAKNAFESLFDFAKYHPDVLTGEEEDKIIEVLDILRKHI